MKPEDINRAIAEHCGWKKVYNGPEPDNRWVTPTGLHYRTTKDLPNYHGDLNAMHEAEKTLGRKWMPYVPMLARVIAECHDKHTKVSVPSSVLLSATAVQRAEAFLRTVGKWKDE